MKLQILFVGAAAILGLAMQESGLPPDHYCMNHSEKQMPKNAHECHCDYVCAVVTDEDGKHWKAREENPGEVAAHQPGNRHELCKLYCKRPEQGPTCTCHPEEPCPKPA